MPTPTYIPLQTITLGSSASSVTFASIPQTYRDLVLVMFSKSVGSPTAANLKIWFNGDTGSNYSNLRMYGNGSSALSGTGSTTFFESWLDSTAEFTATNIQIMDYSAADKHKTALTRANLSSLQVQASTHRWASTSAISSIEIESSDNGTDLFAVGSTFSLYAIEA